jgi:hypothetical protein
VLVPSRPLTDALSSAGALVGLVAVVLGWRWGDPVAGLAVTAFICHVGWEVTSDVVHRLTDGNRPRDHSPGRNRSRLGTRRHPRARPGQMDRPDPPGGDRGWVDPDLTTRDAGILGRRAAAAVEEAVPGAGSLTWTTRAA